VKWLAVLAAALTSSAVFAQTQVLDDFRDASHWRAAASDQVQATMQRDASGALCLRYDFAGVSGHALLRRELPLELPAHYMLRLRLRGHGPANALQLKLVDASGENVWWLNRPDYVPPRRSTDLVIRQRQVEFAWGPTTDRVLRRAAAIELVVASAAGGRGELCFERLTLTTLPAPGPRPAPIVKVSPRHWQVDLGEPREVNGLFVRWPQWPRAPARAFDVQLSDDARAWRTVRRVRGAGRELQVVWLPPELEARHLRLAHAAQRADPPADVQVMGPEQWPNTNAALTTLAKALPRGRLPRGFVNEQSYWTLVGVDGGGAQAAVISEDGALEPRKRGPSLEPFIVDESGKVTTWADVRIEHALRDGYLPLPAVRWSAPGLSLSIEAGADGTRERAQLIARYTLANTGDTPRRMTLALALRPWQVNPPAQFLNTPGGASRVQQLAWRGGTLHVNGQPWLHALAPPISVVGGTFDNGDVLVDPSAQRPLQTLIDEQGLAGAALRWSFYLGPGESRSVAVALPLAGSAAPPAKADDAWARARLDEPHVAARCAADRRHLAQLAGAHADVARRPGAAAGHALVRTQLGARRRDDGGRAAAPGRGASVPRVRAVVCQVPVRQRQGAVLRRRARCRPGA
jgi:hypothetical protein